MSHSTDRNEFCTERPLRKKHITMQFFRLVIMGLSAAVAVRLAYGHPLLPIPVTIAAITIVLPAVLCYGRTAWGDAIKLDDKSIIFLRRGNTVSTIAKMSIVTVKIKKDSVSFLYKGEVNKKPKVIGSEGFTKAEWQAMCNCLNAYVGNPQ